MKPCVQKKKTAPGKPLQKPKAFSRRCMLAKNLKAVALKPGQRRDVGDPCAAEV
jgi:hypothetical protein